MRGVPSPPAHTPKSAWGEEVEPQGHPYHLAGTWFCHLGCSEVPVGCSGRFHASCSPGWLIPSATPECGAGCTSIWHVLVSPYPFPKLL